MLDWLALWGVTQAVGFVFKPILEDLAKDTAKDWIGDYFKKSFKNVLRLPQKEPLEVALGKALKEFLQFVQQELEDADVDERTLKDYTTPLQQFLQDKAVREILGDAFETDRQFLDTATLAKIWNSLNVKALPEEFDWEQVAKRYLRKVNAIRRESEELRKMLGVQTQEAIAESTRELAGIPPEFNLAKYREGLKEYYGNLRLESLDTSGYAYNNLKLWRMFIPQNVRECHEYLPQVYELPKEIQQRLKENGHVEEDFSFEELEHYREIYSEQPIRPVLDIINDHAYPYVVILGDPGSGKSTLLQYIALSWAEQPLNDLLLSPLPLLIELRTYIRNRDAGRCQNFLEFFHKRGSGFMCPLHQHHLHAWLKGGKAVVMFDGLDEVFEPGKREDVVTDIIGFTNEYPDTHVMVTSRVIGYKAQRFRDAEFRHVMLQDLDTDQINHFLQRWHDLTYRDGIERVRKRDRLKQAIDRYSAIRELAGNPLLLTMMAILNRHQELPRDRAELYNQASRVLLHQWDVERHLLEYPQLELKTIDYKDKQVMLRQVAYHMQANEKGLVGNSMHARELETILTGCLKTMQFNNPRAVARVMIDQLRARNFILCYLGADYYAFVHRTFLEYFCAWEFVWQFKETQTLTLEHLTTGVYGQHWQDESWHEVLRLIAGMIEAKFVGEVIENLVAQNGEQDDFQNVFLAAKCLTEVRNRNDIEGTVNKLLNRLKNLLHYGDYRRAVDNARASGNAEGWARIRDIRRQAITMIAVTWRDDPDTLSWLISLTQEDQNTQKAEGKWIEQYTAVSELVRGWKNDPETLSWLKFNAQKNKSGTVREAALKELARGWKDDREILPMLKYHAHEDSYHHVRSVAIRALAENWKDDPDTLSILKVRAQSDPSFWVRRAAMKELAQGWPNKPGMFGFFCDRAVNDPFEVKYNWYPGNPRQTALEAIIKHYPDHPQTLELLSNRAEHDPDEQVREFAAKKLKELQE